MNADPNGQGALRAGARERFLLAAALAFVATSLVAGPLRMLLSAAGLSALIYVPNVLVLGALCWHLAHETLARGLQAGMLVGLVMVGSGVLVGVQFVPPVQVAMGLYVLLPFWFGLVCGPVLLARWRQVARFVPVAWAIAVGGVLGNLVLEYPWEGFGYRVGDLEVEGARRWYANGGVRRLAGFARASFDAAVQIQIAALLLVLQTRSALLRACLWAVSVAAIVPTNSKGILLVAAVLTPIVLARRVVPELPLRALPAGFGAAGVLLPAASLLYSFESQFDDPALASAVFSFYDRMNDMWPSAWSLVSQHGSLLMGRGFGGIGTAQTYFEPELFNAGDNLFVYAFVVLGCWALPGFVALAARTMVLRPNLNADDLRLFCLVLAVMAYGTITNVVENSVFALIAGMVFRGLFRASGGPRRPNPDEAGGVDV